MTSLIQTPSFITTELDSIDLNALKQRLQIVHDEMKSAVSKPGRSNSEAAYETENGTLLKFRESSRRGADIINLLRDDDHVMNGLSIDHPAGGDININNCKAILDHLLKIVDLPIQKIDNRRGHKAQTATSDIAEAAAVIYQTFTSGDQNRNIPIIVCPPALWIGEGGWIMTETFSANLEFESTICDTLFKNFPASVSLSKNGDHFTVSDAEPIKFTIPRHDPVDRMAAINRMNIGDLLNSISEDALFK